MMLNLTDSLSTHFLDWLFFSEESNRIASVGYWVNDIIFSLVFLLLLILFHKKSEIKIYFIFGTIGLLAEITFTLIGFRSIVGINIWAIIIAYFGIAFCDCAVFSTMVFILIKVFILNTKKWFWAKKEENPSPS